MPLLPYVRREIFLQAIKNRDASALPDPNNREELFLKAIAEETALIPSGVSVVLPAEVSEMLANLPEAHTHTERFYRDIIDAILVATTVTDTTPYLIRDTANHAPITPPARLTKKLGNTVGVNQGVKNGDFSNGTTSWQGFGSSIEAVSGELHIYNGTGSYPGASSVIPWIQGHSMLFAFDIRGEVGGEGIYMNNNAGTNTQIIASLTTSKTHFAKIYTPSSTNTNALTTLFTNGQTNEFYISNVFCIDLTLWFGSNDRIPSDLLSHPENWGRYYAGSLDYNAGTLDSADGTVLKSIGRQMWNEQWKNGYFNTTTGAFTESGANNIAPDDYIAVSPNTEYAIYQPTSSNPQVYCYRYDKSFIGRITGINTGVGTFTTPSDCGFIMFCVFTYTAGSYNNDITLSRYYTGESGYNKHYPYSVLAEVDTGSEVLRGVEGSRDEKLPNGTITRNRAVVDMGTIDYTYESSYSRFTPALTDIPNIKIPDHATATTGIDPRFRAVSSDAGWASRGGSENVFCVDPTGYVRFYSTQYSSAAAFKTAMSGVYLEYPLATPTTEQGTAFDPVYDVEYGGTESWTNLKGIPQGHETEYKEYTT